ncbi:geminin coiled-coil domain-containing protein 1 [Xenopus laevis]|uniref:Geminin coiled-coil domain-containing protein 1 n=1 Tax=Xenopus laevis TaxID=8355 RepID=GEMC1_XENLA|nr:geminin coiled-coil domain-containing protein 1 [Xenopus laevis]D3YN49.1 RecName: Full=Geminin coiled-coil domain-containing protein 1; Short=xGEMC1 [Xenopus laevis]ADC92603.1 replication factor GEMC1 [Xenopus laevis]
MNTILTCQDEYFAGGLGYDCPYFSSTSASTVDVSKETWVSLWASGLLDNRSSNHGPHTQGQLYNMGNSLQEDYLFGDQLSSQISANKQLQDTLLQKEEELSRLHEENNKLKEFLNSAFVKTLAEKTKKLLHQNGQSSFCTNPNSRVPFSSNSTPGSKAKRARRNLYGELTACEAQSSPVVEKWVLQTLGLKDVDTIDDSALANYSAMSLQPKQDSPSSGYSSAHLTPGHSQAATSCSLSPSQCSSASLPESETASPLSSPTYHTPDVAPNKTEVAFSTSLHPHCNVKTHSFPQGQAFVRRDTQGGWKFTWVPKQSE